MKRVVLAMWIVASLVGCGSGTSSSDAGVTDAGGADAGQPADAGGCFDAGTVTCGSTVCASGQMCIVPCCGGVDAGPGSGCTPKSPFCAPPPNCAPGSMDFRDPTLCGSDGVDLQGGTAVCRCG